jgi:hypothetical protein
VSLPAGSAADSVAGAARSINSKMYSYKLDIHDQ